MLHLSYPVAFHISLFSCRDISYQLRCGLCCSLVVVVLEAERIKQRGMLQHPPKLDSPGLHTPRFRMHEAGIVKTADMIMSHSDSTLYNTLVAVYKDLYTKRTPSFFSSYVDIYIESNS